MNNIQKKKLENIITKNSRLFNLQLFKKRDNLLMREDFHMSTSIANEVFEWELQMSVDITDEGLIHMMMFLHPVVVTKETKKAYIEFANASNIWLGSALGKFWVNEDNDYCYECTLPPFFIDYEKELEQQLFDKPFSQFLDVLSPLMMLKDRDWNAEKAIEYLSRLKEEGFVDNYEWHLI